MNVTTIRYIDPIIHARAADSSLYNSFSPPRELFEQKLILIKTRMFSLGKGDDRSGVNSRKGERSREILRLTFKSAT